MTEDIKAIFLDEESNQFDLSFKLIVIGDSSVGKSCLTMKAIKNLFDENTQATVGFEFFSCNVKIDNKTVKLQIWDTCGQEIYRSLITNFYRNAAFAIIVYSIDNRKSFENVGFWLKELKNFSSVNIQTFLIGNKNDLEGMRKVTFQEGESLSKELSMNGFLETSAKTGLNARRLFLDSSIILYKNYNFNSSRRSFSRSSSYDQSLVRENKIKLPTTMNDEKKGKVEDGGKDKKCCK